MLVVYTVLTSVELAKVAPIFSCTAALARPAVPSLLNTVPLIVKYEYGPADFVSLLM